MEYRRVGKSGIKVSVIAFGTWLYGLSVDEDKAIQAIHRALDYGINFFDSADAYSLGNSEKILGRALHGTKRSNHVVSTKFFGIMSDDVNDRGLSRKHIMESIDQSLQRLQMEYIDIVFCHNYDSETPLDETVRAFEDLIRQGKIFYWGTSNWKSTQICDAIHTADQFGAYRPTVEQPQYNMLQREHVEGQLDHLARDFGIGLTVYSPLAQGILTGKYNDGIPSDSRIATYPTPWFNAEQHLTDERLLKARALTALAAEIGYSPGALAIAWTLRHPHVSSVITSASDPSQIARNIEAVDIKLTSEVLARIETILANRPEASLR